MTSAGKQGVQCSLLTLSELQVTCPHLNCEDFVGATKFENETLVDSCLVAVMLAHVARKRGCMVCSSKPFPVKNISKCTGHLLGFTCRLNVTVKWRPVHLIQTPKSGDYRRPTAKTTTRRSQVIASSMELDFTVTLWTRFSLERVRSRQYIVKYFLLQVTYRCLGLKLCLPFL